MTDKPIPIDLVPFAGMIDGAREFLRVWSRPDGPVTCFMNPVPAGPDPAGYGMALVDCIRHGANAYARALNIPYEEALNRVWEGVDAERANPAQPQESAPPPLPILEI
jgi:hypothetical protein